MNSSSLINMLYLYAGDIAITILALTILLCLLSMKKLTIPLKRLLYFLLWNLLIEISARIFIMKGINNLPLLHVYTIGEFILFSWFYNSLISKPSWFRIKFWRLVLSGAVLMILNSLFFRIGGDYNSVSKTIVQIIIISYAVLYFYNLTEIRSNSNRVSKSLSLINSAILIYYSGSLFIFMWGRLLGIIPNGSKHFGHLMLF